MTIDEFNAKGSALGKDGQFEEALLYFNYALELDKKNVKALYNKGLTLKNLKRHKEALKCLHSALKLAPNDVEIQTKINEVRITIKDRNSTRAKISWTGFAIKFKEYFRGGAFVVIGAVVALTLNKSQHLPYDGRINQVTTAPLQENLPSDKASELMPSPVLLPQQNATRLQNGTVVIKKPKHEGLGNLTIENGTLRDTVIKMVSDSEPHRAYCTVYVQANSQVDITGIHNGMYRIIFASGENWERKKRVFLASKSYAEFDDKLSFLETRTTDALGTISTIFSTWRITLHPVASGNARQSASTEEEFTSLN